MEVKNLSWNIKQFVTMSKKGTILYDYPIQRSGGQWKPLQQSYLIHSIVQNYPIPAIYFLSDEQEITVQKKGEDVRQVATVRYVLDGKQRLTTITDFVEDAYPLHPDTPSVEIDSEKFDIAGLMFSELDEEVQDQILSRTLLTYTLDGEKVTDEEIEDLFFRMNNGSALTVQQKAKALMGVEWATRLTQLGNHILITELSAFSKTQLKSEGHLTAILQTMMMLDDTFEYKNVSQRVISQYTETFKEDKEHKLILFNEVKRGMDFLASVFDKKETVLLKKVHFPMTVMTALKAMDKGVDQEGFYSWTIGFKDAFKPKADSGTFVPTTYADYCGTGSTDRHKAVGRMNEMIRHMDEYTGLHTG